MSRRAWRRIKPPAADAASHWTPLPGWEQTSAGVWQPVGYRPAQWEVIPPALPDTNARREEYLRCAENLGYFAFRYCWTVDEDDPDNPGFKRIPAWPYLRDFFSTMQRISNVHIEKSRQMTLSWAVMAVMLWDILFHDDWINLCVSKKEKLVDDGGENSTFNSLLGKLRMMHERLPPFLFHRFQIAKNRITNLDRNSTVKGESGESSAGRSGTYKRFLMDEAAHIEHSESLFKSARQAAKNGLILLSTPEGKTGVFPRIRFQPFTTFKKVTYWWPQHPQKGQGLYCRCGWRAQPTGAGPLLQQFRAHTCTHAEGPWARSPWYDRECLDLRPDQIGSELDISYETSVRGRIYDTFNSALHVVRAAEFRKRLGPSTWTAPLGEPRVDVPLDDWRRLYLTYALDPYLPTFITWDFGISDPTVLLLGQEVSPDGPIVRWIDEYQNTNQSWDHYQKFVDGLWADVWAEVGGAAISTIQHYGDPSGKNRESDLRSWITNLASAGIVVQEGPPKDVAGSRLEWIDVIREQYRNGRAQMSDWCSNLIDATQQYHFPVDDNGDPIPGRQEPVHDQWSHPCDAKRYLYRNRYTRLLHDREQQGVSLDVLLSVGANKPGRIRPVF